MVLLGLVYDQLEQIFPFWHYFGHRLHIQINTHPPLPVNKATNNLDALFFNFYLFLITSPLAQWSKPCASDIRIVSNGVGAIMWPSWERQSPFASRVAPLCCHTLISYGVACCCIRATSANWGWGWIRTEGAIIAVVQPEACLAYWSAALLPLITKSLPFLCAWHLIMVNCLGCIMADINSIIWSPCWIGVPSLFLKPLCFQTAPKRWHTPCAYAESV